jgi:hypothetical protein
LLTPATFKQLGHALGMDLSSVAVSNPAPSTTGESVGFVAGVGTTVNDASTFTGNVGSTAYRISDIVKHLKNQGILAP